MDLTEKQGRVLGVLNSNAALYSKGYDWTTAKAIAEETSSSVSAVVRCLQDLQGRSLVESTHTTRPPRERVQTKPRRVWRITWRGRRRLRAWVRR